jgi:hypothetical protein
MEGFMTSFDEVIARPRCICPAAARIGEHKPGNCAVQEYLVMENCSYVAWYMKWKSKRESEIRDLRKAASVGQEPEDEEEFEDEEESEDGEESEDEAVISWYSFRGEIQR